MPAETAGPGKHAVLRCLKCDRPFPSADVRRNRVCTRCNAQNVGLSRLEERGGSRAHAAEPAAG